MAKSRNLGGLWLLLLVLLTLGGGAYWYWQRTAPPPPAVVTVQLSRGEVIQSVTSTGDLQPVVTTEVSSQISGQIVEVRVDYNQRVSKGEVLARLDTATYDSRLRQAEAQLANTKANHNLLKLQLERARTLFERNLVSQQELDQAEAQFQQASAQLMIQTASVENAKTDLSRCTIYAPMDGIVIDRIAEVGRTVAASLNAPTLFTIVNDLTKMQIRAAVAEADIGNVRVGQEVNFTVDAHPNRQFRGRVELIRNLPATQQSVVTYATIIGVQNEDLRLKPGMTANVSIIVARRENVVRVPNAALRARVPQEFILAKAPAAGNGAAAKASAPAAPAGDPREQMRQLMADAGVDFRSGPPSPDAMARLRSLAKERGIELPERFGSGGGRGRGGAGAGSGGGEPTITTRTVYKLAGDTKKPLAEPVSAKFGITDGAFTEAIEGLAEGDTLITSLFVDSGSAASANAPRNPFSSSSGRRPF